MYSLWNSRFSKESFAKLVHYVHEFIFGNSLFLYSVFSIISNYFQNNIFPSTWRKVVFELFHWNWTAAVFIKHCKHTHDIFFRQILFMINCCSHKFAEINKSITIKIQSSNKVSPFTFGKIYSFDPFVFRSNLVCANASIIFCIQLFENSS